MEDAEMLHEASALLAAVEAERSMLQARVEELCCLMPAGLGASMGAEGGEGDRQQEMEQRLALLQEERDSLREAVITSELKVRRIPPLLSRHAQ